MAHLSIKQSLSASAIEYPSAIVESNKLVLVERVLTSFYDLLVPKIKKYKFLHTTTTFPLLSGLPTDRMFQRDYQNLFGKDFCDGPFILISFERDMRSILSTISGDRNKYTSPACLSLISHLNRLLGDTANLICQVDPDWPNDIEDVCSSMKYLPQDNTEGFKYLYDMMNLSSYLSKILENSYEHCISDATLFPVLSNYVCNSVFSQIYSICPDFQDSNVGWKLLIQSIRNIISENSERFKSDGSRVLCMEISSILYKIQGILLAIAINEAPSSFVSQSGSSLGRFFMKNLNIGMDDETSASLTKITEVLERFVGVVEPMAKTISGMSGANVPQIVLIIGLASVTVASSVKFSQSHKPFDAGLAVVCLTALTVTCSEKLRNWLSDNTKGLKDILSRPVESDDMQSHSVSTLLVHAMSMMTGVLSWTSIGEAPPLTVLKKVKDEITNYSRAKASTEEMISDIVSMVESILNGLRLHVFGLDPVRLRKQHDPAIEDWLTDVQNLVNAQSKGELKINLVNGRRISGLLCRGRSLLTTLGSMKNSVPTANLLNSFLNTLAKLEVPFQAVNFVGQSTRVSPVILSLQGKSGVGKSRVMEPLMVAVLAGILPEVALDDFDKNHENYIYTRNKEQEFWDGYYGQEVVFIDDFGQMRTAATDGKGEAMEIIRTGNTFSFPLHMADLSMKGKTNFTSTVVALTTNVLEFECHDLHEQEAFIRRITINVRVAPKEEFCIISGDRTDILNRRLDLEKVKAKLGTGFKKEIYEFHEYQLDIKAGTRGGTGEKGRYTGVIYDFDQMVDLVVKKHKERFEEHENFSMDVKLMKAKYLRDRRKVVEEDKWFCAQEDEELDENSFDPFHMKSQSGGFSLLDCDPDADLDEIQGDIMEEGNDIMTKSLVDVTTVLEHPMLRKQMNNLRIRGLGLIDVAMIFLHHSKIKLFYKPDDFRKMRKLLHLLYCDENLDSIHQEACALELKPSNTLAIDFVDKFKSAWSNFKTSVQETWNNYPVLNWMLVTVVPAVALFDIWFILSPKKELVVFPCITDLQIDDAEDLWSMSPEYKKRGPRKPRNRQFRYGTVPYDMVFDNPFGDYGSQSGNDTNGEQIISKLVEKSIYKAIIGDSASSFGFVNFLVDRVCMMPGHFRILIAHHMKFGVLLPDEKFLLQHVSSPADQIIFSISEFMDFPWFYDKDRDLLFVRFPPTVKPHPNIVTYFMTENQINTVRDFPVRLVVPDPKKKMIKVAFSADAKVVCQKSIKNEAERLTLVQGFEYDSLTTTGDCGALLHIVDCSTRGAKILGMHIAGDTKINRGVANCLTQEVILNGISQVSSKPAALESEMQSQSGEYFTECGFKFIRTTTPYPGSPGVSTIVRSPLYGKWGPSTTAPAHLLPVRKEGALVDPMKLAVKKYAREFIEIPEVLVDAAIDSYWVQLVNSCVRPNRKPQIYDFEKAILGDEGNPYFSAIPRATSAGYPDNTIPIDGMKGKIKYFGNLMNYDLSGSECKSLKRRVLETLEKAKNGERCEHIYTDVLKDERRPYSKLEKVSSRLVSACPIVLTILFRMYFIDFVIWMMENKIRNGVAIGVNCYSADWHRATNYLLEKGDFIIAGDYSAHDASLSPQMLRAFLSIVEKFYDNSTMEDRKVRSILFKEVTNSIHINGPNIYEWFGSLPSGNPLTTVINSVVNCVNVRIAWMYCHEMEVGSMMHFNDNVNLLTYGDDNIMGVDSKVHARFNPVSLSVGLSKIGMIYTSEDKSTQVENFKSLDKATFLKRSFSHSPHLGRYIAPLDLGVIREMSYWTRKGNNSIRITKRNLCTAILELSLHGEDIFSTWAPLMLKATRDVLSFSPDQTMWLPCLQTAVKLQEFY